MSKFNKIISSIGQNKTIRSGVIAAALLGAMTTTQSCKDNKNAGMPVNINTVDLTSKENTENASESITIEDNKVSFSGNFDQGDNPDWMKKHLDYQIVVSKDDKTRFIIVTLKGETTRGTEAPETFEEEFIYKNLKDFEINMVNDLSDKINTIVENLQSNDDVYLTTSDGNRTPEAEENTIKNRDAINNKAEVLLGWLQYFNSNRKDHLEKTYGADHFESVEIPFSWKENKVTVTLKDLEHDKVVVDKITKQKITLAVFDVKIDGEQTTLYLDRDNPIESIEELFDKLPENLRKDISEKEKYSRFIPKLIEGLQIVSVKG